MCKFVAIANGAFHVHDRIQPGLDIGVGPLDLATELAVEAVREFRHTAAEVAVEEERAVEELVHNWPQLPWGEVVREMEESAVEDDVQERLHVVLEDMPFFWLG